MVCTWYVEQNVVVKVSRRWFVVVVEEVTGPTVEVDDTILGEARVVSAIKDAWGPMWFGLARHRQLLLPQGFPSQLIRPVRYQNPLVHAHCFVHGWADSVGHWERGERELGKQ